MATTTTTISEKPYTQRTNFTTDLKGADFIRLLNNEFRYISQDLQTAFAGYYTNLFVPISATLTHSSTTTLLQRFMLPREYATGVPIYAHVRYARSATDTGNVEWEFTVKVVPPATDPTTIDLTTIATDSDSAYLDEGLQDVHTDQELGSFKYEGDRLDPTVQFQIKRVGGAILDTTSLVLVGAWFEIPRFMKGTRYNHHKYIK